MSTLVRPNIIATRLLFILTDTLLDQVAELVTDRRRKLLVEALELRLGELGSVARRSTWVQWLAHSSAGDLVRVLAIDEGEHLCWVALRQVYEQR